MKKSTSFLLALIALLLMSSCVSTKKIVYFQNSDELFQQAQQIMQQYEMRLKPADQVYIKVTCSEPELLTIFAQDVVMGTVGGGTSTSSSNINSSGNMTNIYGFTVTNDGYVVLPAIGRVNPPFSRSPRRRSSPAATPPRVPTTPASPRSRVPPSRARRTGGARPRPTP